MTNRERLLKTNVYDLLCEMQKNIYAQTDYVCIIDAVGGYSKERCIESGDCKKCIAAWLNEEEIQSRGLRTGKTPIELERF